MGYYCVVVRDVRIRNIRNVLFKMGQQYFVFRKWKFTEHYKVWSPKHSLSPSSKKKKRSEQLRPTTSVFTARLSKTRQHTVDLKFHCSGIHFIYIMTYPPVSWVDLATVLESIFFKSNFVSWKLGAGEALIWRWGGGVDFEVWGG